MELDRQKAEAIATRYLGARPPRLLGWGIGGYVFVSPDLRSAVKVHRGIEGFTRELEVYRKLRALRITSVLGITVPKLRGYRTDLKLIKMDVVTAPYLLDFAGVTFSPPDFPPDTVADWHAKIRQRFSPNESIVYQVYDFLAQQGLYYTDFRESNLNLQGLPGTEPHTVTDDDTSDF